eukprot:6989168-Prymnesium_polylepis.1
MRPPTPGCGAFWAVLALESCVSRPLIGHSRGIGVRPRYLCRCPIWDLPFVPARYDMEFRGGVVQP